MARKLFTDFEARLEALDRAGKSDEATKLEALVAEILVEATNKTPAKLVIEIDMGMGPDHKFAGYGFHREKPRRFIGKVKFEVRPVVKEGQPAIEGDKMLQVADEAGCDTTLEEGEQIATYFNSPAGRSTYEAIQKAGIWYLVLPNKDGVWVRDSSRDRCVPILGCFGEQCVSYLDCLDNGFVSFGGLLVPCKNS